MFTIGAGGGRCDDLASGVAYWCGVHIPRGDEQVIFMRGYVYEGLCVWAGYDQSQVNYCQTLTTWPKGRHL